MPQLLQVVEPAIASLERTVAALEEQRSEKYRHALIAVVSIGVRTGQLGGTDAWLLSHLVSYARICRRNQNCDLQKLQAAPLTVPLLLKGQYRRAELQIAVYSDLVRRTDDVFRLMTCGYDAIRVPSRGWRLGSC